MSYSNRKSDSSIIILIKIALAKRKRDLTLLISFFLVCSCIPIDDSVEDIPNETDSSILDEVVIFETNDINYPFIFQHKDGERFASRDIDGDGLVDGLIYQGPRFSELITVDEETGLPIQKITSNGILVSYNFKEDNSLMDIGIISDGETSYLRNVAINLDDTNRILNLSGKASKFDITLGGTAEALSFAISYGSCLTSLGTYASGVTVTGGLVALPAAAYPILACSSFIATFTSTLLQQSDSEIAQTLSNALSIYDTVVDVATCVNLDLGSCAEVLLDQIANSEEEFKKLQEELAEDLMQLEESLERSAELAILGDLNFGSVELGDEKTLVLDVINRGTEPITITSLGVNSNADQFRIETGFPITLGPVGSASFSDEISLTFAPNKAAGEYNTFLKINNDRYDPFDAKAIGAIANNEGDAKIRFNGELNFNGVSLNEPISAFFDVENPNLNDTLQVESITFDFGNLPSDNFSINGWSSGTIEPGKKQEVEVVFQPTDTTEYDGVVVINNNLDNVNNKWPVFGKGKGLEIRLVGDLDFGEVPIGETETLSFDIENPNLNDDIVISNIQTPSGFTTDWTAGTIPPSMKQTVNITFEPDAEQEYSGSIAVESNVGGNTSIDVIGAGINEEPPLSGIWRMQLKDQTSGEIIFSERFTFNTTDFEINFIDSAGTFIQNNYQTSASGRIVTDVTLVVENDIPDACEAEEDETPFFTTQRVTIKLETKGVRFVPNFFLGTYTLDIVTNPSVPCPGLYPNSSGEASMLRIDD